MVVYVAPCTKFHQVGIDGSSHRLSNCKSELGCTPISACRFLHYRRFHTFHACTLAIFVFATGSLRRKFGSQSQYPRPFFLMALKLFAIFTFPVAQYFHITRANIQCSNGADQPHLLELYILLPLGSLNISHRL